MVGLGNVDNTADTAKPVSTATQTALDLKANLASPTFTGTVVLPTGTITSGMILDGTIVDSDINASAAIATSKISGLDTALSAKAPLASPTFTGTVSGITKSMVGLGNLDNTSDANKPVSTATQTALDAKAPLASPTFTGTVSGITKSMVGLGNVDNTADASKPISTATQTALDLKLASATASSTYETISNVALKAPLASPTFTGTVTLPTGTVTSTMILDGTIVDADINASAAIAQSKISGLSTSLGLKADLASPTFTGTVNAAAVSTTGNVIVGGNLTVNGTTTTINSTTLNTTEQVLVISNSATPTDVTANGAGIQINGTTNKTLKWYSSTGALTSSENVDLASGKTYKINGTDVLTATAVGGRTIPASNIVGLTDTQTLTNKTLQTAVATGGITHNGSTSGTIVLQASAVAGSNTITLPASTGTVITTGNLSSAFPTQTGNSGKYLTTDGSGNLSWGSVSGYSAPTLGTTQITSGSTITTISGLTLNNATINYGFTTNTSSSNSAAGDTGNIVKMTSASANTYTITGTYPTGSQITVIQMGAGQTTITGTGVVSSGVTSGSPKLRTQYSSATAIYDGTNWIVIGDII
jgi:hypothetical protein